MRRVWTRWAMIAVAIAGLALPTAANERLARTAPPGQPGIEVDVKLVLMVDVSLSMDTMEQKTQREGYVSAFRDPLILEAIRGGLNGRIAVTYVEWSGDNEQTVVVPWMLIDGTESAADFTGKLERAPISRLRRTSISSALLFGARLIDDSGFVAARAVIDMSGDGSNNEGPPMAQARTAMQERGIVVNGLPLMIDRVTSPGRPGEPTLEDYYEHCVIAGAGSFIIPVRTMEEFRDALKTKLVLEIAGLWPDPAAVRVMPASGPAPSGIACDGRFSF